MAREELAVFTNLCMISDDQGNILVQDRLDPSWPGICFPGGHVEPREAFADSVVREVYEETGLTIRNPRLCGIKQFQTKNNARYVVLFYKTSQFTGTLRDSREGKVFWIPRQALETYPLVPDFLDMVRVFEEDSLNEIMYIPRGKDLEVKLL